MTYTDPTQQPDHRKRAWIIASIITLALIGAGLGVWLTAGSSGSTPTITRGGNLAACRVAMQRQFDQAMTNPDGPTASRPAECVGVSDADVVKIADDIMGSAFDGAPAPRMVLAAATVTPIPVHVARAGTFYTCIGFAVNGQPAFISSAFTTDRAAVLDCQSRQRLQTIQRPVLLLRYKPMLVSNLP